MLSCWRRTLEAETHVGEPRALKRHDLQLERFLLLQVEKKRNTTKAGGDGESQENTKFQ